MTARDNNSSSSSSSSMSQHGVFTDDVSFWPRSISTDLLSLPTGGSMNVLLRLPPKNMLELFRNGTKCWNIAEVEKVGEDPAAAILSNQGQFVSRLVSQFVY